MAYADALAGLGSDAPPPAPPPPASLSNAPSGGSSAYQRTLDALNAALAPGDGLPDGSPTVTVQSGPTYGHTLAALSAALSAPAGTRIVMGASAPLPAGLTPRGAAQPDPDSVPPSARLGGGTVRDAFDQQPADDSASDAPRPLTIRPGQPDAPNPSGPLANAPDDGWLAGAAKGTATGLVKGAGDAVGFVGGLSGLEDYLMTRAHAAITGQTFEQAQADRAARKARTEADMAQSPLGRLVLATDPTKLLPAPDDVSGPVLARTGAYQPTSEVGRLAQAGVEAVPAMLGPGGGMVSPGTAGKALASQLPRQAPAMALGGAASQGAVDATGSPLAGLAAGLTVPALAEGGVALARGGARAVGTLAAPIMGGSDRLNNAPVIGPALQAGREAAVAQKLVGQASDPAALRAWAASAPDASEVPNSPRTLAGAVGDDAGLYQAEKDARNVNNARPTATVTVDGQTYGGQSFNGIDRAQSDAQLAALGSGQQNADVFRPGQMIRDRMDAIEAAAQQAEDRLDAAHADAVQSTTGAGQQFASDQQAGLAQRAADRTQAGLDFAAQQRSDLAEREAARGQAAADDKLQAQGDRDDAHAQLVQGFKDAQTRATEAAQGAASGLGAPVDDDSLGGALRGAVEQVRAGAKDLHRQLYKAVDPDGTLAMVASPIGDAAQRIAGQLRQNGADLSAVEAPLFRRAAALPDVATYGTVHQLDVDLSAAMSAERRSAGETPAWGRLSALKGAVKDAMTNAADNQAAHEARLVQAGVMAPEDTIAARLGQDFNAVRPSADPEARRATGTADGTSAGLGASGDPGAPGAEVPRERNAGPPARGESLQAPAGAEGEAASLTVRRGSRPVSDPSPPVAVDRDGNPLTLADVRDRLGLPPRGKGSNGSPMDAPTTLDDALSELEGQSDTLKPGDELGQFEKPLFYRWIKNQTGIPGGKTARFAVLNDQGRIRNEYYVTTHPYDVKGYAGERTDNDGVYDFDFHDRDKRVDLTGSGLSDVHRIMGTVVAIAKDLVQSNKKVKYLQFSPDINEPSRVKLYRHLAMKFGGRQNVEEFGPSSYKGVDGKSYEFTTFRVKVPDEARIPAAKTLNQSDLPSLDDVAAHVHGDGRGADPRVAAVADAARTGADLPAEEYRGFRGSYRREEDGSQVVRLFKRADASTLPHELGHVFLDDLQRDAADPRVPESLRDDHQAVSRWLGNDGQSPFTRDQHETFARGFERYLAEGKAPTPGLQGVFDRFKGWLQSIYRNFRRLGSPIPDEARAVLDRMLGGGGAGRATAPVRPAIADEFRSQALAAGVAPEEADASARIASAYYHTRAETRGLGEDPAELFKSLRVEGTPGARSRAADRAAMPAPGASPEPEPAPREVGTGPRPDALAFDPDGLRAPTRPDVPRPQDLRAFVQSRGGMRDTGGDLAAMGMPELIGKGPRAVDPDRMREAAAEAGYLGADTARAMRETHPNDLLDALSGDRPVHSVRDEDAAAAWDAYDDARERYDAARGEFGTRSRFGVVPERAPDSSYSRDDIEGPDGPQMREPTTSGLRPNFGGEAAGRLKAANASYADYARTYKNPVVGPGLRTTGYAGDYQRADAAFIRNAVKPGPLGYENARAHLQAAQNDPEAVEAMHDAVLNPLRRAALGPGFLPPAALKNWKESYGPALRALDEVTPGFSKRFDDAGRATQELLDMGAEHAAAARAAGKEAARQAVLDDADRRTRLGQANAADREVVSNLLAERRANDRADAAADKASTSAAIADRAASDRAALAQSKADTAEGVGRARGILRDARATPAARFAAGGGTGVAATEVENAVGGYLKTSTGGATRMRSLVQSVQPDAKAAPTPELEGLRKAGTDWLVRTHTNADGSLSGAKLIRFIRDNIDTLRELYPSAQISMMGAVARDAEAGARWRTTTAIKGGSDSVKNWLAALSDGHGKDNHTTLGVVAVEAIAKGFEHGGPEGAAVGGAGAAALYMLNSMRKAGIRRTADLYQAALADPELARALISKMPNSPTAGPVTLFARQLRRAAILGPMAVGEVRERQAEQGRRRAAGAR